MKVREGWKYNQFEDCFNRVSTPAKIKRADYLEDGLFPIISQDERLVSGYWDVEDDVVKINNSVVVFGDHTRALKYVDFDFVIGADGVRILKPKDFLDTKFIFYFLRWFDVPSLGYSRHYKLLKELTVPIPPLETQHQIVAELDALNSIIDKKKEQLEELDKLAQATFYDMFGDPVENEKGWEVKKMEEVCSSIVRGPFGSALKKDFFVPKSNSTYKVYQQMNAIQHDASLGTYYIDEERYEGLTRFTVLPDDIIMSCSGTIGRLLVIPEDAEKGIINQALLKFTLNDEIMEIEYFRFLMNSLMNDLESKGSGIKNIASVRYIKSLSFGVPNKELQTQFTQKIEQIENKKALIQRSIDDVKQLFDYTMDKYFN